MFFEKVSLVTGGFDPIHSGHIRYFERAKDLSNYLVVGLNGDPWLTRKKGQYFQSWTERADIIRHLNMVDAVVSWDDVDDSACGAIEKCLEISQTVVFCNGVCFTVRLTRLFSKCFRPYSPPLLHIPNNFLCRSKYP